CLFHGRQAKDKASKHGYPPREQNQFQLHYFCCPRCSFLVLFGQSYPNIHSSPISDWKPLPTPATARPSLARQTHSLPRQSHPQQKTPACPSRKKQKSAFCSRFRHDETAFPHNANSTRPAQRSPLSGSKRRANQAPQCCAGGQTPAKAGAKDRRCS